MSAAPNESRVKQMTELKTIPLQQWFDAAVAGDWRPPPVSEAPAAARHAKRLETMAPRGSFDPQLFQESKLSILFEELYWRGERQMSVDLTVGEWQKMRNPGDGPRVRGIRRTLPGLLRNFGSKAYNVGMHVCMLLEWSKAEWYGALGAEDKAEIEKFIAEGAKLVRKVLKQIVLVHDFEKMLLRNLMQYNLLVLVLAGRRRRVRCPPSEVLAWMTEEFA